MKRNLADEPPPFLGSWRRVYMAVVLYLIALITVFWYFGKAWA